MHSLSILPRDPHGKVFEFYQTVSVSNVLGQYPALTLSREAAMSLMANLVWYGERGDEQVARDSCLRWWIGATAPIVSLSSRRLRKALTVFAIDRLQAALSSIESSTRERKPTSNERWSVGRIWLLRKCQRLVSSLNHSKG